MTSKPKGTNTLAILSIICAFLFWPLGLLFGIISLKQIKKSKENGKGLAIAGTVISSIALFFTLIFFLTIFAALSSVGDSIDVSEGTISENEEESEEMRIYSLGETIETNYFEWKIIGSYYAGDSIGEDLFGTFVGDKADGEFIVLEVEVENIDDTAHYLSSSDLKLIDEQGREFSPDTTAAIYLDGDDHLSFDKINPGLVKEGKVVFDIPKGLENLQVQISKGTFSGYEYVDLE